MKVFSTQIEKCYNDNFLGCVPLRFLNLCSTVYFFWFVLSYLQDLFALHSGGLLFSIFNLIVFSKSLAVSNSSNYLFGATWIIFLIFYFDHSKTSVPLQRIIGLFQSFDLQNLGYLNPPVFFVRRFIHW